MRINLRLQIKAGESTCASEKGQFCEYMHTRRFGTEAVCALFPTEDESYTMLEERDGWLQRCGSCLDSEENVDI